MKKITLIVASLLACVGVMAQEVKQITSVDELSNDKAYFVTPQDAVRGALRASASDNYLERHTDGENGVEEQFAFIKFEGKFYLYSIAAKKFAVDEGRYIKLSESPLGNHVVVEKGNADGYFIIKLGGNDLINISTGWQHGALADYNTVDGGNQFTIVEAANVDLSDAIALFSNTAEITYKYYVGEKLYTETTVEVGKGADYPAADAVPSYVTVTGVPTGKVEQDGSYNLQCSLKEDFPFSTTEYFGLTVRGGAKWLFANTYNQSLTTTALSVFNEYQADNYSWIVEGTWNEGFYFKNKKANKYLAAPAEMSNGAVVALVETTEEASKFSIDMKDGQYYIRLFGTNNNCVSDFGGGENKSLKFWDAAGNYGDPGSQFTVVSIAPQDLLDAFKSEYAASVGCANGYDVEAEVIENLTLETIDDFLINNEVIEFTAGEYYIKGTGNGNDANWYLTSESEQNCLWAKTTSTLNADFMWKIEETGEEGSFKLQYVKSGKYFQLTTATNGGDNNTYITSDEGDSFSFIDNGAGKFTIKNTNGANIRTEGNGQVNYWGGEVGETWYLVPVAKEPMTILGAKVGDVEIVEGKATVESISSFDITFDRPVALNEDAEWAVLTDSWGDNSLKAEVLEDNNSVVRFSLQWDQEFTEAGDFYLHIPAGLIVGAEYSYFINPEFTATITIEDGEVAPTTPLALVNVTVGTDVMAASAIVAQSGAFIYVNFDGTFYFDGTPAMVDANGDDATEFFQNVNGLDYDGSNSYILVGMQVGTYTITLPKASFALSMGKAPAEDIVLTVQIVDAETAIESVETEMETVIYDLAGRRVEKMEKGIYIVNGKKVIK